MKEDNAQPRPPQRARVKTHRNSPSRFAGLTAGGVVAGVAATASYTHMQELATHHGQGWLAYLIPLSVDGMILAASLVIVNARRSDAKTPWLAWLALVVGVLVSLAANVAAALPDATSRLISSWPPLAFAVAFELILRLVRSTDASPLAAPGEDDQTARVIALMERGQAEGFEVGRGTLMKELGVTEYQARTLLHQVRQGVHHPLQAVGDES